MANLQNTAQAARNPENAVSAAELHVTSIFAKTGEHAVLDHTANADEEVLVALGYKQEFKRSDARYPFHLLWLTGAVTSRG